MSEPRLPGKSHDIPKRLIWAAWLKVKSNGGAAGADGVTIEQFEVRLADNLYRLWNRMTSGSYFPGPVRAVEIPKKGGTRVLGIPNVIDRVAQSAAVLALEPNVEKVFHNDSYGYRPGRSPIDAVRVCRKRCFQKDWVVDMDVKAFFDSVPWDLMLKAVARHTTQRWVMLYVERWLKAPMLRPDGTLADRTKGTPQGGPISPLIANIFLHYGFDLWMIREFPGVQFERFADDVVVHCVTERQAHQVREAIGRRLADVGLLLHPDKTRIVYCKDYKRHLDYDQVTFTFCGYEFRPRKAYDKGPQALLHGVPAGRGTGEADRHQPQGCFDAAAPAHEHDTGGPRTGSESGPAGLAELLHRVLPERGEPDRQAHGSPSDALGEEEVQAAGTQRQTSKSMVEWGPEAGA